MIVNNNKKLCDKIIKKRKSTATMGISYKDMQQIDEPTVAILVRAIADKNHWDSFLPW